MAAPRNLSLSDRLRWHGWAETPGPLDTPCWVWGGSFHKRSGYGIVQFNGMVREVHRLAYECWNGNIPDGLLVRHKCDIRQCMNPGHLEIGTYNDNMQDKMRRGRYSCLSGEKHQNAKLSTAQVLQIRELYAAGGTTQASLASRFNVSSSNINIIVNNKQRRSG